MQLLQGLRGIFTRHRRRDLLGLSDTIPEDASRLVRELLLVRASADDQLDQRHDEADDQGTRRLLPNEGVNQVEHTVLEVRRLPLRVDVYNHAKYERCAACDNGPRERRGNSMGARQR